METLLQGLKDSFPEGSSFVVLAAENKGWRPLLHSGDDLDFSAGNIRYQLFLEARRQREAVVVLDASVDPRFANQEVPFRSALCCPLLAPWGFAGVAYAEHRERARVFSLADVDRIRELLQSLAAGLPAPLPDSTEGTPWLGRGLLGAAGLSLIVGMGWALTPVARTEVRPARPVTVLSRPSASSTSIAQSYLAALRGRNWGDAYRLQTLATRERYTQPVFEKKMQDWLEAGPKRDWSLNYRRVEVVREDATRSLVRIVPEGPATREESWEWRLVKDLEGWHLDGLPGETDS